ncbi:hypothetical protein DRQ15_02245 [candidate division KSB1 bacterium]|nr:MAG: hypothetical protein DRQ00_06905 [candidate division KSB1 bacterium]RKY80220.1 MAG: hypothetical protein DRQ12_01735 [candidate division KSB1 bacterium]RKY85880.1 MAG: hypothetical protein DRP98_01785 [candidate division KSB1 bacterium]RKY89425.1 MAG: hypothetical protein DRQ11_01120 [candidate division KSB1 bacterium]RKY92458.1 MAG: hypothetical protein DRQ15_02245 [candidate division KSB1 bacterium]
MRKYSKEAQVGFVMFVAIIVLIAGLFYLKGYQIRKKGYTITALFDNVSGLREGDQVTVAGLKVGRVQKMTLTPGGVSVSLWINSWARFPRDSRAVIRSVGVIGEKVIYIELGKSNEYLNPGDTIKGGYLTDIVELASEASDIGEQVHVLLGQLQDILTPETRREIQNSIGNIHQISDRVNTNLEANLKTTQDILQSLKQTVAHIQTLSKGNQKEINNIVSNLQKSSSEMQKASVHLKKTFASLDSMLVSIRAGKGTLGKLVSDETLYQNVVQLSGDIDSLVVDMKKNPRRYISVTLF